MHIVNNIENLYSIDTVKEEMQAAIRYFRHSGETDKVVNERFEIIDKAAECRELFFDQIISINNTSIISQIMNEAYFKCRLRDGFKGENNSILEYYDGKIKFVGYIPILLEFYSIVENYYQNNSKLRSAGTNCR